jgi:putative membrane protein insertion efficiency factor
MKRFLLAILDLYRYWLSPVIHSLFPSSCKFQPTCSRYASEAIELHGALRGSWMALHRLIRCHPFSRGGFDPVPLPNPVPLAYDNQGASTVGTLHDPLP